MINKVYICETHAIRILNHSQGQRKVEGGSAHSKCAYCQEKAEYHVKTQRPLDTLEKVSH